MASNPPSDLSDLSDLLPGATATIREQAVLELVRLRRKLTAQKKCMSYFSRGQVTGRPLSVPVQAFTAILHSKLHGLSRKRSEELIAANPDAASPTLWRLAAVAHSEGIRTSEAFEAWVTKELAETFKTPLPV
jgi:hypothetical protein